MGPESAEIQIIRLIAAEAERDGNDEQVKALRESQLRLAYAEDMTIEPVAHEGKVLDVGLIRRISALIKSGNAAARENSKECLVFLDEALRLSEQANDIIRTGESHYALATAHLNVSAIRDPAKYKFHAGEALKAATSLGPLGLDLRARASVSLGNAIVEEQRLLEHHDPKRLSEAQKMLESGATTAQAGPITRGTAHNGLGNLYRILDDVQAAADEYLAACKEFEAAGDKRSLVAAQTNGALALGIIGRLTDAHSLALEAMAGLEEEQEIAPQLLPNLQAVLAAYDAKGPNDGE
jgi:tetratricopeptide (TPR) repeat protein